MAYAASIAWMFVQNVLYQYQSLSEELACLPPQMKGVTRKAQLLGLCLSSLSNICSDEHHQLLERSNEDSEEVLELCETLSDAILEVTVRLKSIKKKTPQGFLDQLGEAVLIFRKPEWQVEKELVIGKVEDIHAEIQILSQIVSANHARKTCELSDQIVELRDEFRRRSSWLENLLKLNPPKRRPERTSRQQSKIKDCNREAAARVEQMCASSETYCWHRFLYDSSTGRANDTHEPSKMNVVILIGEVGNLQNILGFFVWQSANATPKSFKIDRKCPYQTYPSGKSGRAVTVIPSETTNVKLTFSSADDAHEMREILEDCKIRFSGYLTNASQSENNRGVEQRHRHRRQRHEARTLKGLEGGSYFAEVLDIDGERVLQVWSYKGDIFEAGRDFVYLHQETMGSLYEVRGKSLKLHKARVTRTINGLGHLRGKLDEDSEVLDGDFVLQFASQEEAYAVYELMKN